MANGIEGASNGPDDKVVNFTAELQAKAQGYNLETTQGQLDTFTSAVEAGSPDIKAAVETYELKKIDAPMIDPSLKDAATRDIDVAGMESAFNAELSQKIEDAKKDLAFGATEADKAALGKLAEKTPGSFTSDKSTALAQAMAQVEVARIERRLQQESKETPTNFGLSEVVEVTPVTPDAPTTITSAE